MSTTTPITVTFKIKSTFTNSITHLSPVATVVVSCSNSYTVTEVSAPTNPQYVQHGGSTNGFVLPAYTSSQQTGCPVDTFQISSSNTNVIPPAGLNNPVVIGPDRVVTPSDSSQHLSYTFYVKTSVSNGGSAAYFGPYTLHVGCHAATVTYSNSGSFVTTKNINVGDSSTGVYTFYQPSSTRAWCVIEKNEIVNPDATGTAWTGPDRINPCST